MLESSHFDTLSVASKIQSGRPILFQNNRENASQVLDFIVDYSALTGVFACPFMQEVIGYLRLIYSEYAGKKRGRYSSRFGSNPSLNSIELTAHLKDPFRLFLLYQQFIGFSRLVL